MLNLKTKKMEASNKLIAEFMGHHTYESNGYIMISYSDCNERTLQDTHYHTSWDWLMPVLKKINLQLNPDNYNYWRMINRPTEYDIENVYAQVVHFITDQNN